MNNAIIKVLNSSPIDKAARIVTSQRGCDEEYATLSREELIALNTRLLRKQRLIYSALGITRKKQAENLRSRIRSGYHTKKFDSRLARELVRIGDNLQAISRRISELAAVNQLPRCIRRKIGAIKAQWCEQHPGSIWDGQKRIAPNGQVFSRWSVAQSMETQQ